MVESRRGEDGLVVSFFRAISTVLEFSTAKVTHCQYTRKLTISYWAPELFDKSDRGMEVMDY